MAGQLITYSTREYTSASNYQAVDGSGYRIGDGFVLTAGHVFFEWNRTTGQVDISDIWAAGSQFFDYRNYREQYLIQVAGEIAGGSPYASNRTIEGQPAMASRDSLVMARSGLLGSAGDGLVTFLNFSDLADVVAALGAGASVIREGAVTGIDTGNVTVSYASGRFEFSTASQEGDSGGAYLLRFNGRDYVIGTHAGNTQPSGGDGIGVYLNYSNWTAINNLLETVQSAGNVTQTDPQNLIVGTAATDIVTGSYRADLIMGRGGSDSLHDGDVVGDTIWADDILIGGDGSDIFFAGRGNDTIWGGNKDEAVDDPGNGEDQISYMASGGSAITVTFNGVQSGSTALVSVTATSADIDTDTLYAIERIVLTDSADIFQYTGAIPDDYRLTIEAAGGQAQGDVVSLQGATSGIVTTVDRESGSIRLTTPGSNGWIDLIDFLGAATITGSDNVVSKFVGGGKGTTFKAGAGGGDFTLMAGDKAEGYEGVVDIFRVTTTAPSDLSDAEKIEYLKNNRVAISKFGAEDQLYVNGELFDGNKITSVIAPVRPPDYNADSNVTAVLLSGDSSYGTSYPDPVWTAYGTTGGGAEWGGYFHPAGRIRDVSYTHASEPGAGVISFMDRSMSPIPIGPVENYVPYTSYQIDALAADDEMLAIVINGFEEGEGGIRFEADAAANYARLRPVYDTAFADAFATSFFGGIQDDVNVLFVPAAFDLDGTADRYVAGGGTAISSSDPGYNGGAQYDPGVSLDDFVGGGDLLIAAPEGGVLDGGKGNDLLIGVEGNDHLIGGIGDDTIIGGAGNDILDGGAGDDWVDGGDGNDMILLDDGGADTAFGGSGNDGFYFGGAMDSLDAVDGGVGTLDQIGLQGTYAGLTFGAGATVNVEMVVLLPGSDTRFADLGGALTSYNITTVDANIAAGQMLQFQANTLRAGESFTLNGSAETNGSFFTFGGSGTENLTGGQQSDGFFFGAGRLNADDRIDGQGGSDQLGLQGDFAGANALVLGADQLTSIEMIVLLSASDTRFGGGSVGQSFSYAVTTNNGNVAAGQRMVVQANTLKAGEVLTFDGAAELDGSFVVYGGAGADTIIGSQNADELWGQGGVDAIEGRGGADVLRGGAGNDLFVYRAVSDSAAATRDKIMDFASGDLIDLSNLDANSVSGGQQAFQLIASGSAFTAAGQLRITQTGTVALVEGDSDGDGAADFVIEVTVGGGHTLTGSDFLGLASSAEGLKGGAADGAWLWQAKRDAAWDLHLSPTIDLTL